jgi:hypothetical protein
MRKCAEETQESNNICDKKDCRLWMEWGEDLNCTLISVKKNGRLTLNQIGDRLDISYARVSQIEKQAVNKLKTVFKI